MKAMSKIVLVCFLFFATNLYATPIDDDEDYEEYDDQEIVQTSQDFESETEEKQEYNVDMKPYVTFKYVSSKTIKTK